MPEWALTLTLAIVAPGGIITGILLYRREGKKAPIERQDVQVAQALAISTTANALFTTVTNRLAEQDAKVAAQDLKIETLETKNDRSDTRLRLWDSWYAGVVTNWQIVRLKDAAPPPPNRQELLV